MISIEIKHIEQQGKIIKSEKTVKFFGIIIKRSTYYYPELPEYEVETKW